MTDANPRDASLSDTKAPQVLYVEEVRDRTLLDTVTLKNGKLSYDTGNGKDIIETPRRRDPDLTDEQLFTAKDGWSNGYIRINRKRMEKSLNLAKKGEE